MLFRSGSGSPTHAIVTFSSDPGFFLFKKTLTKKIALDSWERDFGFYRIKELNVKQVLKGEPYFKKFDVSMEGPEGTICTSTFLIRNGD